MPVAIEVLRKHAIIFNHAGFPVDTKNVDIARIIRDAARGLMAGHYGPYLTLQYRSYRRLHRIAATQWKRKGKGKGKRLSNVNALGLLHITVLIRRVTFDKRIHDVQPCIYSKR